jgi:hypothetical protein
VRRPARVPASRDTHPPLRKGRLVRFLCVVVEMAWTSTSLPKSAYVIAAALSPLRSTNALLRTFANMQRGTSLPAGTAASIR